MVFQNLRPIDHWTYISPTLIVQQTLPARIHHPGSVCLRHLGELSSTISFSSRLDGIEKRQSAPANSKIQAGLMIQPGLVRLEAVSSFVGGWAGWNRLGCSWGSAACKIGSAFFSRPASRSILVTTNGEGGPSISSMARRRRSTGSTCPSNATRSPR